LLDSEPWSLISRAGREQIKRVACTVRKQTDSFKQVHINPSPLKRQRAQDAPNHKYKHLSITLLTFIVGNTKPSREP